MKITLKNLALIPAAVAVVIGAAACSGSDSAAPVTSTETVTEVETVSAAPVTETVTTSVTPDVSPVETQAAAAGPKTSFGNGIFAVGEDVAPGTYKTSGPTGDSGCAYTFLPSKGADLSQASGGNSLFGPGYMDLQSGQIVQTIGCEWTLDN